MAIENEALTKAISESLTSLLLSFSLAAITVWVCLWAFSPFLPIMLWALVLAVALYPVYVPLKNKMGGASGRSATLLVVVGILLIGVPAFLMGGVFASQIFEFAGGLSEGQIKVPEPTPDVAKWPIVGEKLFAAWKTASVNLPAFLHSFEPHLVAFGKWLLHVAAGTAGSVFQLILALIVAGIMLAWADEGSRSIDRICMRFVGPEKGTALQDLTTKTVRSVAVGIIRTAFIQAFLLGVIFVLAGVPGAGVLAVIALILGIMQVPVSLVALVGIVLLWMGEGSTLFNVLFTVMMLVGGLIDNLLKPMLLGRGLDVPMPVILLGALGGMVSGGMLGMFIGSVFLAAGYKVFVGWVETGLERQSQVSESSEK